MKIFMHFNKMSCNCLEAHQLHNIIEGEPKVKKILSLQQDGNSRLPTFFVNLPRTDKKSFLEDKLDDKNADKVISALLINPK